MTTNHKTCILAIKLFDGSTIKHEFDSESTLLNVREWLDHDIEVIPSNKSMPSFATRSYPYPTGYLFHRPVLPRITYNEEQESNNLINLQLTPRSILILKPTYDDETNFPPKADKSKGYLKSLGQGLYKLSAAIISFFDYGVDPENHNEDEPNTIPQPIISPQFVSLNDRSISSSLLNIQHPESTNEEETNRPKLTSQESSPSHVSSFVSRSPTPRPLSSSRVQTIHDEQRIDTYNGNSVNLNERDEKD